MILLLEQREICEKRNNCKTNYFTFDLRFGNQIIFYTVMYFIEYTDKLSHRSVRQLK